MDNATLANQLRAEFNLLQSKHDCLRHIEAPLAMGLSALLVTPDQGWRVVATQLLPIMNAITLSGKLTNKMHASYAVLNSSMDNLEFYRGVVNWVFPTFINHFSTATSAKM